MTRQIEDQVRFLVVSGALPPGQELPSTRTLAAELGVHTMTVSKAYGRLVREGVLRRRPGRALVARPLSARSLAATRVHELQAELRSSVFVAQRLGFTPEEALEVFREMLAQ